MVSDVDVEVLAGMGMGDMGEQVLAVAPDHKV
jgi:hypothetical protein